MRMLLLKNWRDIKDRKAQFAALILLVGLGITSYVAFVSSYRNLTFSADQASIQLHLADFEVKVLEAPRAAASAIADVPGVAAVSGNLVVDAGLVLGEGRLGTARIIGIPAGAHPAVNDILVEQGEYPQAAAMPASSGSQPAAAVATGSLENAGYPDIPDPRVIVDRKFAKETGAAPGGSLTILAGGRPVSLVLAGIGTSADYIYPIRAKGEIPATGEFAVIYMVQEDVERLFGRPDIYTDFAVLTSESAGIDETIAAVEKSLAPYQLAETVRQPDIPSNFALREEINQNQSIAFSMPLLILIIATLTLSIALSRLVKSQRGQIGLAKALGYGNLAILFHYLVFALVIALAGSALGFGLGQLFSRFITQMYVDLLSLPFLESGVYGSVILWSVLMSAAACVAAGLLPAWTSARMPPAYAMRADPNLVIAGGRIPFMERILSPVLPPAFAFRIPLRNIFRVRRRSIYTVIGIIFALVLTISTWSLFDSFDYLLDRKFNFDENWDVSAVFRKPLSQEQVMEIRQLPGVERLHSVTQIPVRLEAAGGQSHEGLLTIMDAEAGFRRFEVASGAPAQEALSQNGLILPRTLAEKLGARAGDTLQVRTPYLPVTLPMTLMTISEEAWGTSMFTGVSEEAALMGVSVPVVNGLYLDVEPGTARDLEKQLYRIPETEAVIIKDDVLKSVRDQLDFIYLLGGVLLAFGFSMAFVVIYNTFTANIMERSREIATMRTIGEDGRHLAFMVTLENLLLAVVAIPVGIVAGLVAADALYGSLSTEAYSFKVVVYPLTYVWIILSILGVLLVSEIPPILRIFRLDLAEATKVIE